MKPAAAWRHPTAIVDRGAHVGAGSKIWHFCHVMRGARIGARCTLGQNVFIASDAQVGAGCRIQNNVSIYDGVVLGDDVFVGPSAVFTNVRNPRAAVDRRGDFEPTIVGTGATIGANATIVCGVTIGAYAFIGAGAVVTRDVAPHAVVSGVPARRTGWICRCGETRGSAKKEITQCACQIAKESLEARALPHRVFGRREGLATGVHIGGPDADPLDADLRNRRADSQGRNAATGMQKSAFNENKVKRGQ